MATFYMVVCVDYGFNPLLYVLMIDFDILLLYQLLAYGFDMVSNGFNTLFYV